MGTDFKSPTGSPSSIQAWTRWLKQGFPPSDLDDRILQSLFNHLADLGLFESCGRDRWKISGFEKKLPEEQVRKEFFDKLRNLSETDQGFVLGYFLGKSGSLSEVMEGASPATEKKPDTVSAPPENTADLSNLQIVKKMGRQLQPFLDLEKKVVSRLLGTYTCKEDAQRIFHYIFSKTREKAKPKEWEQLSRRRHK